MTNSTNKTTGVVLTTVPYNDRTQFVHIYTESMGKVTCKVTLGRMHHAGGQRTLYAPLTVVDLVLECRNGREILQIKEAALVSSPYLLSMSDMAKTAQCLYMAELLDKTIGEIGEPNPKLWDFIRQSIELLQLTEQGTANFHLVFTTKLCHLIGFHVDNSRYVDGMKFDISEGIFTSAPIMHPYYLTAESARWLHKLLETGFSGLDSLRLTKEQRNILLDMILTFLRIHMPEIGNLRSVDVLKQLFA